MYQSKDANVLRMLFMKNIFGVLLVLLTFFCSSTVIHAQNASSLAANAAQEMQKSDPQAAQAFNSAMQRGDLTTAKKIYEDFKAAQKPGGAEIQKQVPVTPQVPSIFERTLSGTFPSDIMSQSLQQFGYDIFLKTSSSIVPSTSVPVGPDYSIGPGDQFTVTLWGTTEGIYTLMVSKEGEVTLPKVGVVSVAGLRFGELEKTLKRHLSKYYSNFNLSVAMGNLKTISVYVVGEVADPGNYNLSSLTTVYGALFAAGGPTKKGTLRAIQVLRAGKIVKTIDLYELLMKGDRSQGIKLQHEDTVFVPLIGPIAGVAGMVYRPAIYELKGNESIGDVIQTAGGIMPIALGSRLQLNRFANNRQQVLMDIEIADNASASLKQAPELAQKVQNMDLIRIMPIYANIWEFVSVSGDVRNAGNYQWRPDLKLKEIIEQAQLLQTADKRKIEIVRLTRDFKDRTIIELNLEALLNGDEKQNVALEPRDQIRIYTMYRQAEKVSIQGEVASPGEYEITKGQRLSDLLRRVGGFTKEAYPYGSVFKRLDVKNAQAKNLQTFLTKMQSQALQSAAGGTATAMSPEEASYAKGELALNQSLLQNLKAMQEQFEGRIAIDINENIDQWAGTKDDLLLKDGDSIIIPKRFQEVMLMGEVHSPSALVYLPGMTVKQYVNQTGGYTNYAEQDQTFVIQANGFAVSSDSPSIGNIEKMVLHPGDTIIVPQKMDRYAAMRNTKDIVDILFKTAVVIATITILF
jgi:polysaccharide biosynthesis/export protein